MTDRVKFEQMLEHLINEDQDKAKELFHNLIVEKSREIYESLLAEEFGDEEDMFDGEESEDEIGGDETDDFVDDVEYDSEESEDEIGGEGEEELEDRVIDLEDALDELRAEFEKVISGDSEEDESEFVSDEGEEDFGSEDSDEGMIDDSEYEDEDEEETVESFVREYVEKVAMPKGGDKGANSKSPVAKPNKMGGSASNIVNGGEEKSGGTKGGLLNPSAKEEDFGNINVPGGNAGKTAFKSKQSGHGAEKKGTKEQAQNKKSIVGSR